MRWKPLHEQPRGWDPDIDDGVRLNIRPFDGEGRGLQMHGVLRAKPDNTWSNAKKPGVGDRGKEPEKLRPREAFPWSSGVAIPRPILSTGSTWRWDALMHSVGREFTGVR
ncbi:MAG: hypothetical protein R3F05_16520 [Planctomycetota bacterium]